MLLARRKSAVVSFVALFVVATTILALPAGACPSCAAALAAQDESWARAMNLGVAWMLGAVVSVAAVVGFVAWCAQGGAAVDEDHPERVRWNDRRR